MAERRQPEVPVLEPPRQTRVVTPHGLQQPACHQHAGMELVPVDGTLHTPALWEAPVIADGVKVAHAAGHDVHGEAARHEGRGLLHVGAPQQVVAVQHAQPAALRVLQANIARVRQPAVGLVDGADARLGVLLQRGQDEAPCVVRGAVVHDDELPPLVGLRQHAIHRLLQVLGLVVRRHHHREEGLPTVAALWGYARTGRELLLQRLPCGGERDPEATVHVGLVRVHERVVASEVSLAPTAAAPGALRMEHALHGVGPNWQAALRVR
mmetsp:Transcript_14380/g.36382  ORF Transcript_14380/g.36382 Transcript_14380/m.36382 type:complete len:267 (+) Transcript_14380:1855-2655(+)